MSNKTNIYSLGTSTGDVQNHSDVQRPSTLLEKFFLQIIDEVRSGNKKVIERVQSDSDITNQIIINYFRTDNRVYTEFGWKCDYDDGGDPLDNYVHEVISPSWRYQVTKRESFELKCKFLSMFRNEKWFKKNVDEEVFHLIDEYDENLSSNVSNCTLQLNYDGSLHRDTLHNVLSYYYKKYLIHEIDDWYKVFQVSLPKSNIRENRRLKHHFTLTDEQRNELWELLVRRSMIEGDLSHYEEFVKNFTNHEIPTSICIWSGNTSDVLIQLLYQMYEDNNVSDMTDVVSRVMGMTGGPNVMGNPL